MANVADYDIVSDGKTFLGAGAGQDPDRDFPLGFDQHINVGIRSVLSYMVDPGSSGVTFKISVLNPGATDIVSSTTLPAQSGHVRQEVIGENVLKKTGNTLRIQVTAGSATFSDIVLMHQSTV
jgi:hypothetical protein